MRPATIYSTAAAAAAGLGMLGLVAGQVTTVTSESLVPVTTIVESAVQTATATATAGAATSPTTTTTVTSAVAGSSTGATTSAVTTAGAGQLGVDGSGAAAMGMLVFCAMGMAMM